MRKVQLGTGGNVLEGWENYDYPEIDVTKPLPFENDSIDFLFMEHLIEHLTHIQALTLFHECFRVLKAQGIVRVIVPDVCQIAKEADKHYYEFLQFYKLGSPVHNIVCNHTHQSAWTRDMLRVFLVDAGFGVEDAVLYSSVHKELDNIDGHGKAIGCEANNIESVAVEGTKR